MDQPSPPRAAPPVRAAWVRRPHGVQGAVRAEALGGDAVRFHRGLRLTVEVEAHPLRGEDRGTAPPTLTVRSARDLGDGDLLLRFEEIESPEAAAPLRGAYLCVPPEQTRPLGDGEWFIWELVGLRAVDPSGAEIGRVSDVESGAAHDVLVVESPGGERRFPMVSAFVASVEVQEGRIVLTPWEEEGDPSAGGAPSARVSARGAGQPARGGGRPARGAGDVGDRGAAPRSARGRAPRSGRSAPGRDGAELMPRRSPAEPPASGGGEPS